MMKKAVLFLAICLAPATTTLAGETVPPKTHPDSSTWQDLFAEDLSNAVHPRGVWSFEKGVLTATADQCIWTKKEYDNFLLDFEFKTAAGTNSGVIVYCSDLQNWIPNAIEIQIADDYSPRWSKAPKSWQCAAFFGFQGAKKRKVKKPGEWNRMTVACKDTMLYVLLNGELVNEMDMRRWTSAKKNPDGTDIPSWLSTPLATLPTKGRIGLQGKHGGVPIYFRNLKVTPLDGQ